MHKQPQDAGCQRRGPQVLRLGLQERRQDGRRARLRADARQASSRTSRRRGRRDQGHDGKPLSHATEALRDAGKAPCGAFPDHRSMRRWPARASGAASDARVAASAARSGSAAMQSERSDQWSTLRCRTRRAVGSKRRRAPRSCGRLRLSDAHLPQPDARGRHRRAGAAGRRHRGADRSARCRRCRAFGFGFLVDRALEPGDRDVRRAGARSTARSSPRSSPC